MYKERLKDVGVLHYIELCWEFQVYKDDAALDVLVSRWDLKTCTFVTAWGEFTPTLKDVQILYKLYLEGNVPCSMAELIPEDKECVAYLEEAHRKESKCVSHWDKGILSSSGFPESSTRKCG